MKSLLTATIIAIGLFAEQGATAEPTATAPECGESASQDSNAKASIKEVLEIYADGEHEQLSEVLETILSQSFSISVIMNGELVNIPRQAFLDGIETGKFGGENRLLIIGDIELHGNTATATMQLRGELANFHHFLTLVLIDEEWTMVHSLATLTMHEK